MGHVIGKTRCPKCAERGADTRGDNLILYSDGGSYCFSCGYTPKTDKIKRFKMYEISNNLTAEDISLPEDVLPIIPDNALNWFYSYGFSHGDVVANKLLWSEEQQRLIFPILDEHLDLYAWQGRYFGEDIEQPKWKSRGKPHGRTYIKHKKHTEPCILVEDVLSCWKIAKAGYQVGCLFGSNPSMELVQKYASQTWKLIWWLDHDKRSDSVRYALKCKQQGIEASNIFTVDDPKSYSIKQIHSILKDKYV